MFNAKTRRREVIHLTMKNMKVMKIIHESANKRTNGRVHSLTPVFDFSCSFVVFVVKTVFLCVQLTLGLVSRLRDVFCGR